MHISLAGLVLLVILLTWSTDKIDDAATGLFKCALYLVGAIAACGALWFAWKFLCAHPWEILGTLAFILIWLGLAWRDHSRLGIIVPGTYREPSKPYRDSDFEAWRASGSPKKAQPTEEQQQQRVWARISGLSNEQRAALAERREQEAITQEREAIAQAWRARITG